jgi:hypothetical protein
MKLILTRWEVSNMLESTGEDFAMFHIFFRTDTLPELTMPMFLPYDYLVDYIMTINEDAGRYLKKIRTNMHGYGPKHSKVLAIIREEEFNLEPYIRQYVERQDEDYIAKVIANNVPLKPEAQKQVQDYKKKMDEMLNDDFRNYQINLDQFRDELDRTLHELTLKFFPGLFEKSEKHLASYKNDLVNATLSFSTQIDRVMHDKFDKYFEEQYEERLKAAKKGK